MSSLSEVFDTVFKRQVEELQLKIDSLPGEQRPHLQALLEATRQQHDELRESCDQVRQMFDQLMVLESRRG